MTVRLRRRALDPSHARPSLGKACAGVLLVLAALGAAPNVAAEQPPRIKACGVAVVDKELLTVHCPKGRLVELLTAIRDKTGVAFDLPPDLLSTPVSVVLDRAPLQTALDAVLAKFNYTLDGPASLVGGKAGGTSVIIFSLRESAADNVRDAKAEPAPSPTRESRPAEPVAEERMEPAPSDPAPTAADTPRAPSAQDATHPPITSFPPSVPEVSAEQEARAREAFFANLPRAGAALPQAPASAQLPQAPMVTNSTGPGDGRRGLPLPDFTPGTETANPPGIPR